MRNTNKWLATKFIKDSRNRYVPNADFVNPSSWLVTSQYIEDYARVIKKHCYGNVLDCGCGNVPYFEIYKDHMSDNYCIDWISSMHDNIYIDEHVDLNEVLPIKDQIFDTVLLIDVLEHIKNPELLIHELFRVLRKNGKLILMTPFYYMLHEQPFDYFRYTKYGLKHLCEQQGLSIEELFPYGGYFDVLGDLFNKRIFTNKFSAKCLVGLFQLFKKTFLYKRYNRPELFPLGYVLVATKP